jgi:hypothetical protein
MKKVLLSIALAFAAAGQVAAQDAGCPTKAAKGECTKSVAQDAKTCPDAAKKAALGTKKVPLGIGKSAKATVSLKKAAGQQAGKSQCCSEQAKALVAKKSECSSTKALVAKKSDCSEQACDSTAKVAKKSECCSTQAKALVAKKSECSESKCDSTATVSAKKSECCSAGKAKAATVSAKKAAGKTHGWSALSKKSKGELN